MAAVGKSRGRTCLRSSETSDELTAAANDMPLAHYYRGQYGAAAAFEATRKGDSTVRALVALH